MATRMHRTLWIAWLLLTACLLAGLAWLMLRADDKSLFMPGPLSPGHHQLQEKCSACHADPLGGGEVLQETCIECHGEDRRKPHDSHPRAKFTDPRNADRLEQINALRCVTCHVEHKPEITRKNGVTRPRDLCFHCHSDIAQDRPSHAGMAFTTCSDAGCHNFHNNRALYTDFLVKHLHEPDLLEDPRLPAREFAGMLDEIPDYPAERYPVLPLQAAQADAPTGHGGAAGVLQDWAGSAHARSGVNCSACHQQDGTDGEPPQWTDHPGMQRCGDCHALELQRFQRGKHGMRLAAGLPPLTPASAQLPMHADVAHRELTCNSCHAPHRYDTTRAAVESCLECHDDRHSRAYPDSPHHRLWQREQRGELPPGSGVSCAGCHMPRIDHDVSEWVSRIMVDHNQSADLAPNSKMIRPACLHCHGLGFAIDALADPELIDNNFSGPPGVHVDSMAMAERDLERARRETDASPE